VSKNQYTVEREFTIEFKRRRRRPVVKIMAESLSQHDEKYVVPTPLIGIMEAKRKKDVVNYKKIFRIILELSLLE
jgi:hypothetical protein